MLQKRRTFMYAVEIEEKREWLTDNCNGIWKTNEPELRYPSNQIIDLYTVLRTYKSVKNSDKMLMEAKDAI